MRRRLAWMLFGLLGGGVFALLTWWAVVPGSLVNETTYAAISPDMPLADLIARLGEPDPQDVAVAQALAFAERTARGERLTVATLGDDTEAVRPEAVARTVGWSADGYVLLVFVDVDDRVIGKRLGRIHAESVLDRIRRYVGL